MKKTCLAKMVADEWTAVADWGRFKTYLPDTWDAKLYFSGNGEILTVKIMGIPLIDLYCGPAADRITWEIDETFRKVEGEILSALEKAVVKMRADLRKTRKKDVQEAIRQIKLAA